MGWPFPVFPLDSEKGKIALEVHPWVLSRDEGYFYPPKDRSRRPVCTNGSRVLRITAPDSFLVPSKFLLKNCINDSEFFYFSGSKETIYSKKQEDATKTRILKKSQCFDI
jgi:hypothetical protein